ncbi:hypothetical protein G3U99_20550 [Vibrio coralliilyticus OCN008]|uniref:hypothetical protein n=1 Tax=Vibrio coralliilyticus TaxID=190893 RepID=UPI00039173BF|nr:hypothetical protein [Vibrio coralliilyticus]ERB66785.1 hypothetical protein N779_02595 [Vibrio coralliilyticus OCN008]QIJ86649.1 hypothetical protein G3U99_20550 [Vibrio coralliilyticus OCN008]
MAAINEEKINNIIKNDHLKDFTNYDIDDVCEILISLDKFDKIKEFHDKHYNGEEELKYSIFYAVVRFVIENNPNRSVIDALEFLIQENNEYEYEYELDDEEFTYFMCKFSENIKTLELFHKLDVKNIDWGKTLFDACNFLQIEMFDFIIDNFNINDDDIINACLGVIESPLVEYGIYNEDQNEIISMFINKIHIDVNSKSESEWGYLILDCLIYAPYASKYFYTKDFDSSILSNEEFWEEFIEGNMFSDTRKTRYTQVFKDMDEFLIDTKELEKIFYKLDHEELANELF